MTTPKRNEAVARYAPGWTEGSDNIYMHEVPNGNYVRHSDYAALQGEVSRLRGLLDAVEVQAEENFHKWDRSETKLAAHREAEKLCCKAFDDMFDHCLSNGVFNAWGKAMDCTSINAAKKALTNLSLIHI